MIIQIDLSFELRWNHITVSINYYYMSDQQELSEVSPSFSSVSHQNNHDLNNQQDGMMIPFNSIVSNVSNIVIEPNATEQAD